MLVKSIAEAIGSTTEGKFTWRLESMGVFRGVVGCLWDVIVLGLGWCRIVGGHLRRRPVLLLGLTVVVGGSSLWCWRRVVVALGCGGQGVSTETGVVVSWIVLTVIVVAVVVVAAAESRRALVVLWLFSWCWTAGGVWGCWWCYWQMVSGCYESGIKWGKLSYAEFEKKVAEFDSHMLNWTGF